MKSIDSETEEYTAPVREPRRRPAAQNGRPAKPRVRPDEHGPEPAPRPARPRRQQKPAKPENTYTFISFLKDYRTHLAVGIILCLTAIVATICGVSFVFNNAADQSVMNGRTISEIVQSGDTVEQAGGVFGARLAQWLLVDSFGIGSFILAFYVFVVGLAIMRFAKIRFFTFTFRCLFTAVALSVIVGLLSYNHAGLFNLGGAHGQYINQLLLTYSDALGAYAVSIALLGILVAIFLHPLGKFIKMLSRVMRRKPAITPEEEALAAAQDDETAVSAMDVLGNEESEELPDEATLDEEQDEPTESETDAESDNHTVPLTMIDPEVLTIIPSVGLDAFEEKDPDAEIVEEISEIPFDENPAEITSNVTVSDKVINDTPAEPALIIRQPAEAETTPEQAPVMEIKHGDHIGLDQPFDVRAAHANYKFPPVDLLQDRGNNVVINQEEQLANKNLIVEALRSYNIEIQRIEATIGPTVTLYEIVPQSGTRIAKIKSLEDDIAMSLSALGIRIIAPIPGKGTIGIEVPNRKPQIVSMRNILQSKKFKETKYRLPMALGSTISNEIYMADLAELPHLLVAGATGQGKSVGLNCIIASLLYTRHPDELKFVLVDPKTVEFSLFETISKQYLAKLPDEEKAVITDPKKTLDTLNSLCVEMDDRYKLLSEARVKTIVEYNERITQRRLNPEDGHHFLPYLVVIVDEYADLITVGGKEIALPIMRIAQKARAVGIHMIIATQRPSTDIITGPIKANFPARIAFKTTSGIDSKTILDRPGAQRLIGRGDMLALMKGQLERVQCAFVDTGEIEAICDFIGNQDGFTGCYLLPDPPTEDGADAGAGADCGPVTEEFKRCALFITTQSQASITMLQRKFEIGFNKAGRFMDQMQQMGIVGPARGAKPRDVLMTPDEAARLFE